MPVDQVISAFWLDSLLVRSGYPPERVRWVNAVPKQFSRGGLRAVLPEFAEGGADPVVSRNGLEDVDEERRPHNFTFRERRAGGRRSRLDITMGIPVVRKCRTDAS
jgi:hypothetical protein